MSCKNNKASKFWRSYLLTYFQGLNIRLKNEAWKVDVLEYGGFKTRMNFENEIDYNKNSTLFNENTDKAVLAFFPIWSS